MSVDIQHQEEMNDILAEESSGRVVTLCVAETMKSAKSASDNPVRNLAAPSDFQAEKSASDDPVVVSITKCDSDFESTTVMGDDESNLAGSMADDDNSGAEEDKVKAADEVSAKKKKDEAEPVIKELRESNASDTLSWKEIIDVIRDHKDETEWKVSENEDKSEREKETWKNRPWKKDYKTILPTLYYEDEGGDNFTKKRIYFMSGTTLGDFKQKLRDNLRSMAANSKPLKLNYVEVIPGADEIGFDVCVCRICGNQDCKILPKEGKSFNQHLNVHAMEMFYGNAKEEDNVCIECAYFSNLNINIGTDKTVQTRSQPYLLMTGFFLSPAFWVMLALPVDLPVMMLLSVCAIIGSSVVGVLLVCWGYGLSRQEIPFEVDDEQKTHQSGDSDDSDIAGQHAPKDTDGLVRTEQKDQDWEHCHDNTQEAGKGYDNIEMQFNRMASIGTDMMSTFRGNAAMLQSGQVDGTRIQEWFKDPYNLVYKKHLYYVIGSLIVLNMINVFELIWLYARGGDGNFNAAYECTWADHGESIDAACVVYFELVGSAASVLLSMLFINVAVIRRPKEPEKGEKHASYREHSLLKLKKLAVQAEEDGVYGVTEYFMSAIDVIEEVRESEAPAFIPNSFTRITWPGCCPSRKCSCCRRSLWCHGGKCWVPSFKMILIYLLQFVFMCLLIGVSLYTHPEAYVDKLTTDWGHFFPVIVGHAISVLFIYLCCMVMFKVTMIFRKAYALMQISSSPLNFIGSEVPRPDIDKLYRKYVKSVVEKRKAAGKTKMITLSSVSKDLQKRGWDKFQKYCSANCSTIKVDLDDCMKVIKRPPKRLEINESDALDIAQDERVYKYLNAKLKIVTPEFLQAWMALRDHIQKWELRYFFELTQPLVSLEIMFVLAALTYAVVTVLQEPYNGDMRLFFKESVSGNSVLVTLGLFLVLVIVFLLHHLDALLKPYQVQRAHEAWLMKVSMQLQIEHANRWEKASKMENITRHENDEEKKEKERDSELSVFEVKQIAMEERRSKLEAEEQGLTSLRELISSMKKQMSENRSAPKLLGLLELNETLIQTISATISTAVTGILLSFVTGVMTEIGENSGFYPTSEPTSAPTWEPTWWETTA